MKEIKIVIMDDLYDHLEKVSQMVSVLQLKDISIPVLVAKTVSDYCKFGLVDIDFSVDGEEIVVETRSTTIKDCDICPPNVELEEKLGFIDW